MGRAQGRAAASATLRSRQPDLAGLVRAGYQEITPVTVQWRLGRKPACEATAIARCASGPSDTVALVCDREPPRPYCQCVLATGGVSLATGGVSQTIYWAKLSELQGFPGAAEEIARQADRAQAIRDAHARTVQIPANAFAFDIRKVRMSNEIKSSCSLMLASATMMSAQEFADDLTDPLYQELVEGGYVQPDGSFTDRGIDAATRDIGEHFIQKHLQTIADRDT